MRDLMIEKLQYNQRVDKYSKLMCDKFNSEIGIMAYDMAYHEKLITMSEEDMARLRDK